MTLSYKEKSIVAILVFILHAMGVYGLLQLQSLARETAEDLVIQAVVITPPKPKEEIKPPPPPPPPPPRKKVFVEKKTPEPEKKALPKIDPLPMPPVETSTSGEGGQAPSVPEPQVEAVEEVVVTPPRQDPEADNEPPEYPRLSRRLNETGSVLLNIRIMEDGSVAEVEIKKSSGYPRLDAAAVKAAQSWHYLPAKKGSEAVAIWHLQSVKFTLQ